MIRNLLLAVLIASSFLAISICEADDEEILNIGDAPPALTVSSWVKGEKIEKFEPGKTYVVEFWATWCGPCRASIPHLTELAHQYKDRGVQFVGVDVWENDQSLVRPFVEEMGDKMDYSVAMDIVPERTDTQFVGEMATSWMSAAEETGIPAAFVIKDGKIQWIGHPLKMDEPLAKIVAGEWDATDLAKARLAQKQVERKLHLFRSKLAALREAKDFKGLAKAIDEGAANDEQLAKYLEWMSFLALCNGADVERGLGVGESRKKANWDNASQLNNDAWNVIDPKLENEIDPRVAKLALDFAARAVELTKEEESMYLDTLAVAQFRTGDVASALATEEKAIVVEKSKKEPEESLLKDFRGQIEWFRKNAKNST